MDIVLISHRGSNNHNYGENTILGVLDSLNKTYIDGVEIDIRITKDNEIILIHDNKYNGKVVENTNYSELNLDKLDDLLSRLNTSKLILIEIKMDKYNKTFADVLYKKLNNYRKLNIMLCSFNYKFLINFKKKHKDYKVGLIIGENVNNKLFKNIFDFNSIKYIYSDKLKNNDFVWTINDIEIYKKVIEEKHVHVITNVSYELVKEKVLL